MGHWSAVDCIEGIAVDDAACQNRHQLVALTESKRYELKTLHYIVYHQPNQLGYCAEALVPKNFEKIMHNFDYSYNPTENMCRVSNVQSKFNKHLRPFSTKGFQFNEPADAVIYDIKFDNHYNIVGYHVRPALAQITQHYNPKAASFAAFDAPNPNITLRHWHNLAAHFAGKNHAIDNPDKRLNFSEVTNLTGFMVQNYNQTLCLDAGIDYVGRVLNPNHYKRFSHATAHLTDARWLQQTCDQWVGTQIMDTYLANKADSLVLPSTSGMKFNDTFNIYQMYHFLRTNKNLFHPETVHAMSQGKNHINVWKRHGWAAA